MNTYVHKFCILTTKTILRNNLWVIESCKGQNWHFIFTRRDSRSYAIFVFLLKSVLRCLMLNMVWWIYHKVTGREQRQPTYVSTTMPWLVSLQGCVSQLVYGVVFNLNVSLVSLWIDASTRYVQHHRIQIYKDISKTCLKWTLCKCKISTICYRVRYITRTRLD